jgi:ferredoxin-NADP reductase
MMRIVDRFLNRFTMYRLILYYLSAVVGLGFLLSFFGVLPADPAAIASTTAILLVVCFLSNWAMSRLWKLRVSPDSSLITALILALIFTPVSIFDDPAHAGIIALSGVVAICSKYLIAVRKQHVFNPAAFGALFSGLVFGSYASWWVGSLPLLPLVALGGFLLSRKIGRLRFVGVFLFAFLLCMTALALTQGLALEELLQSVVFVFSQTSLIFFAVVMLTEPMTSPKRFPLQAVYLAAVALLYQPQLALFGRNFTPEEALLIGNVFSFIASPSFKLKLPLKERSLIGSGFMSFTFPKPPGFTHRLGQFMEWSLPIPKSGSGGSRRYFSIASSSTEPDLMIAARVTSRPSRFKQTLSEMEIGRPILAGELGGDFVLPRRRDMKLAFIAGGIGIAPFRSMLKYLTDTGERRDIVLLYSNYREEEIVFKDIFRDAEKTVGLKPVFTLTDQDKVGKDWSGRRGLVDAQMIREEVPDFKERVFFVSGAPAMVNAMKKALHSLGVRRGRIRTDAFTGYST